MTRQKTNFSRLVLMAFAGLLATHSPESYASGEQFCHPTSASPPTIESWADPTDIPWTIDNGIVANLTVPGMIPISCIAAQTGADEEDYENFAGVQSIMRAARRWSNAQVTKTPPPGGGGHKTASVTATKTSGKSAIGGKAISTANPNPITTFSLAEYPDTSGFPAWQTNTSRILTLDGVNRVTFWEPPETFQLVGGPFTVAIALVDLDLTTGEILEGDIAFNVRTQNATTEQPYWSFVEYNSYLKTWLASHSKADATTHQPELGFVDIEGVATHEFGHFAGLGHTLVDSEASAHKTHFPSMFAWGTGNQDFSETFTVFQATCNSNDWVTSTGSGSLEGFDARTLEADDRASIGELYPSSNFATQLGSISGVVDLDGTTVKGAHVVAVHKDYPKEIRVGTLSNEGGEFTIPGLPPGDYYVQVEPVDQGIGAGKDSHYFHRLLVPNYVYLGPTGCVPIPEDFFSEYYDEDEDIVEDSSVAADAVSVTTGQDTQGTDFEVGSTTPILEVRQVGVGNGEFSQRGVILQGPAPYNTVEFSASYGRQYANQPLDLVISPGISTTLEQGQLNLVNHRNALVIPTVTDAAGNVSELYMVPTSMARQNLFVQAIISSSLGDVFSNPVNLWIASL